MSNRRETLESWALYNDCLWMWLLILPDGGCRINVVMYLNCFHILYSADMMKWMSIQTKKKILKQKAKELHNNLTTFKLLTK